jgi:hypothetical protein
MAPGDRWDLATFQTHRPSWKSVLGALRPAFDWDQQTRDCTLSICQSLARSLAPAEVTFLVHFLSAA